MEKRRKTEAIIVNGKHRLSKPIIQRIQSFLNAKQAAQTTILSKSWNKAWLTRLNLDFDERDFYKNGYHSYYEFSSFAKKIMTRYEESNLKIESFSLCLVPVAMFGTSRYDDLICYGVGCERIENGCYLYQLSISRFTEFVLPPEVLGSENLVRLSLQECKIELENDQKVRCSRLESLCLTEVEIGESDVISKIISSCPFIETLSFSSIRTYHEPQTGLTFKGPQNIHDLHKLRCLVLFYVKFGTLFYVDMDKFPFLKDLTLDNCGVEEELRISSRSLESLNFTQHEWDPQKHEKLMLEFDVPSIRKFTFKLSAIPSSLSFESTSREWESHVSIESNQLNTSWFYKHNKLLMALSLSKIYLYINCHECFDYDVGDIQGVPKHEVENLNVDIRDLASLSCYGLFDGLFRICRPKFITQNLHPGTKINDFLCKTLVREMNEKCSIPNHLLYDLHDIEEVNVQVLEECGGVAVCAIEFIVRCLESRR